MKYVIRITALAVILPFLFMAYSDLLESDKERLAQTQTHTERGTDSTEQDAKPITFTYQEMLVNSEVVVVPIPEYASTPKDSAKQYNKLIQVASFKSELRAKQLRDELITKDFPNVQLVKSSNSDWYSITVGPFVNRSLLNKAQDTLAQMNYVTQVLSVK